MNDQFRKCIMGKTNQGERWAAKLLRLVVYLLTLTIGVIQLYTLSFGVMSEMSRRVIFWTLMTVILLILNPSGKKKWGSLGVAWDISCISAAAISGFHIYWNWMRIAEAGGETTFADAVFAFIALIVVLESTRRVVGWILVSIPLILIVYSLYGASLPDILAHRGYGLSRVVTYLYKSTEGIFGIPTSVAATYVIVFVTFGAFLDNFGAGKVFVNLAFSATKFTRGGPAKAAVVASALLGTISGSSTGNVVTTGTFTIPLMKKAGYPPEFAGGVEAAASLGGMIMPPVMGAAAFLMAEITGIPYAHIALAAAIPAFLYFLGVYSVIDFRTRRQRIQDATSAGAIQPFDRKKWYLFIPLLVLIYCLIEQMSAPKAAIQAILSIIALSVVFGGDTLKRNLVAILASIDSGVRRTVPVAGACFCAGLIVGLVSLTGLGSRITDIILALSHESILVTLALTALVALVLSMGLPTTAVYIIVAVLLAPTLIHLGVSLLAAHLFIFYFGMLSSVTPPVALGAYAAAGIAGSNPNKTAVAGFKLAMAGFLIPFAFSYNPAFLAAGPFSSIALSIITGVASVVLTASSLEGYLFIQCQLWERIFLFTGSLGVLFIEGYLKMAGVLPLAIVLVYQTMRMRASFSHKTLRT
jgi:TRAP transporter 4TM/12TM fusion protein